jgi:peptide/nickel transport system ATP-binding protein
MLLTRGSRTEKRGINGMDEVKLKENDVFLRVEDLYVEYTSEGSIIRAVNGVSFNVARGRTLGLVGETGAGKTTVAKTILRILPQLQSKVTRGKVWCEGQNLLELSDSKMRSIRGNKISMIFQDPMTALNPIMRVGDQVAEVIKLHYRCSTRKAIARAIEILEMVGIKQDRFLEYPHQFSGGMKQRVIIAMALACEPDLLLADEPTTALDVTIQAQVLEMINDLKSKMNTAMIMITHDLGIVAEVCDDVAVVYAGEIVESGSKEEVFRHPSHPYTIGLFGAVPSLKDDVHRLSPIVGMPPDPSNLPAGCAFSPRCPNATNACLNSKIGNTELGGTHVCRCINIRKVAGHVRND